ncbi:MAG: hypothetical protein WBI82_02225 [Sphaerochaeta sp.]
MHPFPPQGAGYLTLLSPPSLGNGTMLASATLASLGNEPYLCSFCCKSLELVNIHGILT